MQQKQIQKSTTGVDTLDIAKKSGLANLKANVDTDILKYLPTSTGNLESKVEKLDVDILLTVPVD